MGRSSASRPLDSRVQVLQAGLAGFLHCHQERQIRELTHVHNGQGLLSKIDLPDDWHSDFCISSFELLNSVLLVPDRSNLFAAVGAMLQVQPAGLDSA
jgi:hypothetical protein